MLRQAYTDPLAHQKQFRSLDGCPKNAHEVLAGHHDDRHSAWENAEVPTPSQNRWEGVADDDGWCGLLMLSNIRAGQSIDGWFSLQQADGSPVIGSNTLYLRRAMTTCSGRMLPNKSKPDSQFVTGISGKPACVHLKISYRKALGPTAAERGSLEFDKKPHASMSLWRGYYRAESTNLRKSCRVYPAGTFLKAMFGLLNPSTLTGSLLFHWKKSDVLRGREFGEQALCN
jgi:hypothetical protein